MGRILIVEDETHMRRILASNLRHAGHEVAEAAGTREAKRVLAVDDFEVAFVDQRMPDGEGLEVLAFARDADPALSVVMLTAVATIELAVEAMRRGAFDVLTKPFEPEAVLGGRCAGLRTHPAAAGEQPAQARGQPAGRQRRVGGEQLADEGGAGAHLAGSAHECHGSHYG